jgi:polyphosphate kinase
MARSVGVSSSSERARPKARPRDRRPAAPLATVAVLDGALDIRRQPAAASHRYLDREMSLLDYNARVLARAEDETLALLERVRFLHHFDRALDDFFQIRVAGLKELIEAAPAVASMAGRTPAEQLHDIRLMLLKLIERETRVWESLQHGLAQAGIDVVNAADLPRRDLEKLAHYFRTYIFPVLTPLAVDPGHPFPYISHFSLNLAVVVRDPLRRAQRFARLKVPPLLPRFVALPDGRRFVPLEQVIASQLQSLFPGMEIVSHTPFRVTRDNDLEVREAEADDLMVTIQTELVRQRRRAQAVRLEIAPDMPAEVRQLLVRELELGPEDVYAVRHMLDLGGVDFIADLERPDLKEESFVGVTPARLAGLDGSVADIFTVLAEGDLLVHHPYDSFANTVVEFIRQAAADPLVLAIKQTLYRTSPQASPIAQALVRAAEAGKQVVALVELKARGDEQANIEWAQRLEEAGVHVVYGLVGLKTHAKLSMVVRQEAAGIRRYCHVATGNYNPNTAKAYEDLGLLTADPEIGADVSELFNFLTGYSRQRRYRRLLVAPMGLRAGLVRLIRQEAAAPDGRIEMKVNNLTDQEIIDTLYEASQQGVQIDLIVRSVCCLRPGVPGLSDNIRVRSLVGHFLEHSRIFRFGSERRGPQYHIGSADMMDRNLDRRVEAVVPVSDSALQARLQTIFETELADDCLAWTLAADGSWHKVPTQHGVNTHERLKALVHERARLDGGGFN